MAYTLLDCGRTQFAVDWGVVERFTRSYWFSYYHERFSNSRTMSESHWYNPMSWHLPDVITADTDWDRVHIYMKSMVEADMATFLSRSRYDMRGVAEEIQWRLEQTVAIKQSLKEWLREIQRTNIAAMHRAEDDYNGLIEACKFVRDTSADVVAVGSTVATGGVAGSLLLAGSSTLKGVYKYQDTRDTGTAVLYGAGSLVLGAFKLKSVKLLPREDVLLIIAQGVLEGGTSFASGKSFGDSVSKGAIKIAGSGAAHVLFGSAVVKNIFKNMAVPFKVTSTNNDDVANSLIEKLAKKTVEKSVRAGISGTFGSAVPPVHSRASIEVDRFIDTVPIEEQGLLYFSIVNMDNGIGRGW